MSYYIRQTVRRTYLKYLVEAEDEGQASLQDGRYIGCLDGDIEDGGIIGGPFETADAAMANSISYTEGQ